MPWHIEHRGDEYCVIKDSDGESEGCHPSREAAQRQLAALYASESDKEKQMTRLNKTYEVTSFKALPDDDGGAGRFEAKVSVFGNVDSMGDVVMDDAFDGSIARWQEKGDPIPVIWSHDWGNPHAHIGSVDPSQVRSEKGKGGGLIVAGSLDLDNPFAAQVYRLLKERRVKEFSFAYDVIREKQGRNRENQLHELDIIEVGPTLKGANPSTELLNVKSQLDTAAAEAVDAGYYAEDEVRDRILDKSDRAMGARPYDNIQQIPEEWSDLVAAVAGTAQKNASNQSGGSFEEEEESRAAAGDTDEAIEQMGKSLGEVTVDVKPVLQTGAIRKAAEQLKAAFSDSVDAFIADLDQIGEKSDDEVTDPSETDTGDGDDEDSDKDGNRGDEDEPDKVVTAPKADPDAALKARLADLEAMQGV